MNNYKTNIMKIFIKILILNVLIMSVKCNISLHHHYISKCCRDYEDLQIQTFSCKQTNQNITQKFTELTVASKEVTITRGDFNKCSEGEIQHFKIDNITTDGRVILADNSSNENNEFEHYTCVDYTSENYFEALFCNSVGDMGCIEESCIQKCCPFGQTIGSGGCDDIEIENISLPHLSSIYQSNQSKTMLFEKQTSRIKTNMLQLILNQQNNSEITCHDLYILDSSYDDFEILKTGQLRENDKITSLYCLEYYIDNTTSSIVTYRCVEEIYEYEQEISNEKPSTPAKGYLKLVYICLISLSLVAILATLIVYLIVPDLRNLHGYIIISNLISIGLVSVYLLSVYSLPQVKTIVNEESPDTNDFCVGIGYFGYFSWISMIVWMTTMCWDLCWTFTRAKIPSKTADKKKFAIYSCVSWGIPILGSCLLGVFQVYLPNESLLNPRIGHFQGECFVPTHENRIRYHVYLPVLLLLGINCILYLSIILSIIISKRKTSGIRTSTRKDFEKPESRVNKKTKEQLKLYTKLFLVVGLLWLGEVVHHFHHHHGQHNHTQGTTNSSMVLKEVHNATDPISMNTSCSANIYSEVFYRILGGLNLLRGVFLFIIFVCKKNVLKKLKTVFNSPKPRRLGSAFDTLRASLSSKLSSEPALSLRAASAKNKILLENLKLNETKSKMNLDEIRKVTDVEKLSKKQSILNNFATSQRIDNDIELRASTKEKSVTNIKNHEPKDFQIKTNIIEKEKEGLKE